MVLDVGTSESTRRSPGPYEAEAIPTLTLILPLLRQCTTSAPSPAPAAIVALVSRLLISLERHPAPPLDVGLEAGSLLQILPEAIVVPLRQCMSGLMADLSAQDEQQATSMSIDGPTSFPPQPISASDPSNPFNAVVPTPILASDHLPLPLSKVLGFLLIQASLSSRWTPSLQYGSRPPRPPDNYTNLIRLGPRIAPDPVTFIHNLIGAAINLHCGQYTAGSFHGVQRWVFLTEILPALLKWWKEQHMPDWSYPVSRHIPSTTVYL